MTYAEKRFIKEKSLEKTLRIKLETAKNELFKDINENGGVLKARAKQEQQLNDFIASLCHLNLSYAFKKRLERQVQSFVKSYLGGIQ